MANPTLNDRDMTYDVLSDLNDSHVFYANVINHASNQQLRQTMQQIRNSSEQFQMQLSQMACDKGFHDPGPSASQQAINEVKTKLSNAR